MSLEKMLAMQKVLDARIIKEKGLEGQDLYPNTVLALIVELGEFANEGRWFKHWSNDQEPRIKEVLRGADGKTIVAILSDKNPLLTEYVDCVHFFLSTANQKGWEESLYIDEEAIEDIRDDGFQGGLTGAFLEVNYWLVKSYMEIDRDEKAEKLFNISKQEFSFKNAWFLFLAIGLVGFNFTSEQIEASYMDKNAVNHQRQENGY
jgi:dimeric dUTPase (all-alpha-NTP-PPase superfamily)